MWSGSAQRLDTWLLHKLVCVRACVCVCVSSSELVLPAWAGSWACCSSAQSLRVQQLLSECRWWGIYPLAEMLPAVSGPHRKSTSCWPFPGNQWHAPSPAPVCGLFCLPGPTLPCAERRPRHMCRDGHDRSAFQSHSSAPSWPCPWQRTSAGAAAGE